MMWKVYIAKGQFDYLYTGVTTDLDRRIKQHNSGKGSKWCRAYGPVEVVWTMDAIDRSEAQMIEAQIKKLSRKQKLKLIGGAKWQSK